MSELLISHLHLLLFADSFCKPRCQLVLTAELVAAADDVIEEGVAGAEVLREADVLLLPLGLPHHQEERAAAGRAGDAADAALVEDLAGAQHVLVEQVVEDGQVLVGGVPRGLDLRPHVVGHGEGDGHRAAVAVGHSHWTGGSRAQAV